MKIKNRKCFQTLLFEELLWDVSARVNETVDCICFYMCKTSTLNASEIKLVVRKMIPHRHIRLGQLDSPSHY